MNNAILQLALTREPTNEVIFGLPPNFIAEKVDALTVVGFPSLPTG